MPTKESKKKSNASQKDANLVQLEENDSSYISKTKEKILEDENIGANVKQVLDEVFTEMIEESVEDDTIKTKDKAILPGTKDLDEKTSIKGVKISEIKDIDSIGKKKKDLKPLYENKLKELDEKIEDYNNRYKKLEETTQRYEDRNRELVEKRKEFETIIKEYEQKSKELEESKNEFNTRSEKLREAREQFINLNKQWEMKRADFEKKEKEIRKMQWMLEKSKYEFEKNKIDLEKEKLDLELGKSELELITKDKDNKDYSKLIKDKKVVVIRERKLKGKAEVLQDFLQELSDDGNFQSCYLIDNKGMIVAEFAKNELDTMAVGAMFSLTCTNALKTVANLHLQELDFFKLSTAYGEFMAKNINISDYERNFFLLGYYDGVTPTIPKKKKKMEKKVINKIFNSIKDDFLEFGQGNDISWIFDNLTTKINFLKQKYSTPETDIEHIRLNLLNKTSVQIKELFES